MPIFVEIRPLGAELFHVERQTQKQTAMTNLIVTFRNFANALDKGHFSWMHNSISRLCWPESRCINLHVIHVLKMYFENYSDNN